MVSHLHSGLHKVNAVNSTDWQEGLGHRTAVYRHIEIYIVDREGQEQKSDAFDATL